jgi:hypothetical protein
MKKVVSDVVDQGFSNFGGVMFWAVSAPGKRLDDVVRR